MTRSRSFGYRKDLLNALKVPASARQGLLVVHADDDERLYHCGVQHEEPFRWARYRDLADPQGHAHCEICWATFADYGDYQREGWGSLDGNRWLCADCFDEIRDHFTLRTDPSELEGLRSGSP